MIKLTVKKSPKSVFFVKTIGLIAFFVFCFDQTFALVNPVNLRCEYLVNPEGIDMPDPRFFWQLVSSQNGEFQTAYHLLVSSSEEKLERNIGDAFDSGMVRSGQNTHVVYGGKSLLPASQYFWKVKVWDSSNRESEWSEMARFSTGLFGEQDWKGAEWIAWKTQEEWETNWWKRKDVEANCLELHLPSYFGARMSLWERYYFHHENPYDPSPLFRKEIETQKPIKSAKVFICGIGYHELFINGKRVGDHVLDPGWTNYKKSVLYVVHDVTGYFQKGENAIGVMLGRGNYGMLADDHWGFYKKGGYIGQPKLKCRFKITYEDGTDENIVSDLSWKVMGGPVVYDCPHMGEIYDATKEIKGWASPGLDDSNWAVVNPAPSPGGKLKAQLCEPIRVVKTFKPLKVETQGWQKETWVDAGTNLAGWLRFKLNVPKGTRVCIYYGENENVKDFDQPGGYQQMAYIANGEPDEIAECHFSYKGFRYALITGCPSTLTANDIEICQVNSDVDDVGHFLCSDSILNQIHRICRKAMISNLHSIPTDCPHREKNGWMGDAVTGIEMGMANYNLAAILTKYIADIFNGQDPETGGLSVIAPDHRYNRGQSSLWGSAGVYLPWYMYQYYGDTRLIETYWDNMMHFVRSVWGITEIEGKTGLFKDVLSDWSSPFGNRPDEGEEVYATMNFYRVLKLMSQMAEIIGRKGDASDLKNQAAQVEEAIYKYCYNEGKGRFEGIVSTEYRQGPNALALYDEIAKPEHQQKLLNDLIQDISVTRENHIYGGIFTGHALWELLPMTGNAGLAYNVAVNETYPGYGFMIKNGATTLWEHWKDESSHIHYFMGFVDNFFYRHLAGINFDSTNPGFKVIHIEPDFIKQLDYAEATYQSIQGKISVNWEKGEGGSYILNLNVPVNCVANVVLPGTVSDFRINNKPAKLKETAIQHFTGLSSVPKKNVQIPSGNYSLTFKAQ